jgi:hypothetical protein
MHLAAHQKKYKIRNQDYNAIVSNINLKKGINYQPKNHE